MSRLKKRIIKKKQLKKQIKSKIHQTKQQSKPTADQQARTNEMLKTMLSRPQQILPQGTTSQTDELKQKIDALTRHNVDIKNQYNELRRLQNEGREETQRIHDAFRQEQEANRRREQHLRNREAEEDRLNDERDRSDRLQRAIDELDISTEAGRHRQRIAELTTEEHSRIREREQNEAEIRNNELYQQLQRKQADVDFITKTIQAQRDIIDSEEFKNPNEALQKALFEEMVKKNEKDNNEEIIKRQMNIMKLNAEMQANQQYIDDYTSNTQKIPERKSDGSIRRAGFGIVYKKDRYGKPILTSKADLHTQELAEQVKAQETAEIELQRLKLETDNYKQLSQDTVRARISNENTQKELQRMKQYQESDEYLPQLRNTELMKKEIELKEIANRIERDKLESDKKMKRMEVQAQIASELDPLSLNVEQVQTQMSELSSHVQDQISSQLADIKAGRQLYQQKQTMHSTLDSILDKYSGSDRETANRNILKLISDKTNEKLKNDLDDYSLYHLQRVTEFMSMIGERDDDLLLNPEKLEAFEQDDTYKNFDWRV